jgi:5'-3' exonuclease
MSKPRLLQFFTLVLLKNDLLFSLAARKSYSLTLKMGVRGLLTHCKPIQRLLKDPGNLKIGLDAFCILYLFKEQKESLASYLDLLVGKHQVTVVLDGRAPPQKRETVEDRAAKRSAAATEADELSSFTKSEDFSSLTEDQQRVLKKQLEKFQTNAWSLHSDHVAWFKGVCREKGVTLLHAIQEADDELVKGGFDAVISGDSDLLLHSVKKLWIPRLNAKGYVVHSEIDGKEFSRFMGLEGDRLFELAYLAGCDVQPVSHAPLKIAISWLRFYGDLERVVKKFPDKLGPANLEEYRRLKESVWAH